MKYRVKLTYFRPSDDFEALGSATVEVEALSHKAAIKYAKQDVRAQRGRKVEKFDKIECTPIVPTPAPRRPNMADAIKDVEIGSIIAIEGRVAKIAATFPRVHGGTAVVLERQDTGASLVVGLGWLAKKLMPKQTIEHWTVYPNGNVYTNDHPVRNSSYDIETDLVRLKITKVNGKIVKKELL